MCQLALALLHHPVEAVPLPLPAYNEPVVWRLQEKAQFMNQTDVELLLDCLPSVVPVECEKCEERALCSLYLNTLQSCDVL